MGGRRLIGQLWVLQYLAFSAARHSLVPSIVIADEQLMRATSLYDTYARGRDELINSLPQIHCEVEVVQ
jgi:hypothetical protein